MFKVVPYKHEHVLPLLEQKINAHLKKFFTEGPGQDFEKRGTAFTGILNGKALVCGAVEQIWEGRGVIWCVFSEESKYNFVLVFRAIKEFLKQAPFNRIELSIRPGFDMDKRRAELLGFKLECPLARKYLPSGEDCAIYALVRE